MLSLCELPIDILTEELLPLLHIGDLATLASTCRHLKVLCNEDRLWRYRAAADFSLDTSGLEPYQGWKQTYKKMVDNSVVYVWGENYDKRLGTHDNGMDDSSQQLVTPIKMTKLAGKGIAQVVTGGWSFHALDYRGRVWMWGLMQPRNPLTGHGDEKATFGVVHLPSNIRITSLASGRSHAIALDEGGRVWHWSNRWQPMLVKSTGSAPIIQITACAFYSAALSRTGDLYIISYPIINSTPNVNHISMPLLLHSCDRVIQIAGMDSAILVLTDHGRLFRVSTPRNHDDIQELLGFSTTLNGNNRLSITAHHHWFAIVNHTENKIILGDQRHDQPLQQFSIDTLVNRILLGKNHMGILTVDGTLLTGSFLQNAATTDAIPLPGRRHPHDPSSSTFAEAYAAMDFDTPMHVYAAGFGGEHSACLALPREIF